MLTPPQPTFLEALAAALHTQHGGHLPTLTVVFPTWRAGSMFKRCLARQLSQPTWSPNVLNMHSLMLQLSPLKQAQPLVLTKLLYQTFQTLQPSQEPFERFHPWGSQLLQDFSCLDSYLVDANRLFSELSGGGPLTLSHKAFTAPQREAIHAFWSHFGQGQSAAQVDFLQLWRLLPQVYQRFTQLLREQGIGYQGLCYRAAYEGLVQGTAPPQSGQWVFAGFNALTAVEESVLVWYQKNLPTQCYWDVDDYYMEDSQQEAGIYLRGHQAQPHFRASFVQPAPKRLTAANPVISLTSVASSVGQAEVVCSQLQTLMEEEGAGFSLSKTAIIVANKALLLPLLHALPFAADQIACSLGYPLTATVAYQLLEQLLALQLVGLQRKSPPGYWPTAQVCAILNHPHVLAYNPLLVQASRKNIQKTKAVYLAEEALVGGNALYATLFKALGPKDPILPYLVACLHQIQNPVGEIERPISALESNALRRLVEQLTPMQRVLTPAPCLNESFAQLLRQLLQPVKLSLGYTATDGVQMLAIADAQNLDFDNVFIVGMNEGKFPPKSSAASFIPYNLRKGHGLPIAEEHQGAVYGYHFYRLLQRAKKVYITYSTQSAGGKQDEMSRYLLQLLYASPLTIKTQTLAQPIHLSTTQPIVIPKVGQVLQKLRKCLPQPDGTAHALSPSALNTYLDCSLRFYFQYLAKLKAPDAPQESTHALVFGNLLHEVMEKIYAPLMQQKGGQLLQKEEITALKPLALSTVQDAFARALHQGEPTLVEWKGDDTIAQAVMVKLVTQLLTLDEAYAPFSLIGLEMGRQVPLQLDFALDAAISVRLRGIIDRVDCKNGVFRVLDYKTGLDNTRFKSVEALFDSTATQRNKAAFQTLFYSWLFQQQGLPADITRQDLASERVKVMPGLLNTRQIFEANFTPYFLLQQPGGRTYAPLEQIIIYQDAWEEGLREVLTTLLDPALPFVQTTDETRCVNCPYKGICQRH